MAPGWGNLPETPNHATTMVLKPMGHWSVSFLNPLTPDYIHTLSRWGSENDVVVVPLVQHVLLQSHEEAMMFFLAFA